MRALQVQHNAAILEQVLSNVPLRSIEKTRHGPAAWIFFGRNTDGAGELAGRAEHTDAVAHSGTWHLQLAGSKVWYVRATSELIDDARVRRRLGSQAFRIECRPGDLILINTRCLCAVPLPDLGMLCSTVARAERYVRMAALMACRLWPADCIC